MMKEVFSKPRVYWFIGVFVLYLALNVIFSGFYDTIPLVVTYASTVNWLKLGVSLILTIIISFLIAVVSVLSYIRYKERRNCKNAGAVAGIAGVSGLIVGVCPLCVSGIFPLLLGALGFSFSFASLPFQGIEVQFLIIILLLVSLKMLKKIKSFKEKSKVRIIYKLFFSGD